MIAAGPGSVSVRGGVENSQILTDVTIESGSHDRSQNALDGVDFPRLDTPIDLILRIAHADPEEVRFDALDRGGRQVGPFRRRIGKNPEDFAVSNIGRDLASEEQRVARLRAIGLEIADLIPKELLEGKDAVLGNALAKRGVGPSILILTDEAFIPGN